MSQADKIERQLQHLQAQIEVLEGRVEALERGVGVPPVQTCRLCGKHAAHRTYVHPGEAGHLVEWWDCSACKERDLRVLRKASTRQAPPP